MTVYLAASGIIKLHEWLIKSVNGDAEILHRGMFKFKAFKATLSDKVVNFLKEKYSLEMSNIYRFELESLERLEAERDTPPPSVESSDEEED